jgi:hypothetical protein
MKSVKEEMNKLIYLTTKEPCTRRNKKSQIETTYITVAKGGENNPR